MEIKLSETAEKRLKDLATKEGTTSEKVLEMLLDRRMHVIDGSLIENEDFISFAKLFEESTKMNLDHLMDTVGPFKDIKMYQVFKALYDHAAQTPVIMSELYDIYKN